jgi:hypothetical protein
VPCAEQATDETVHVAVVEHQDLGVLAREPAAGELTGCGPRVADPQDSRPAHHVGVADVPEPRGEQFRQSCTAMPRNDGSTPAASIASCRSRAPDSPPPQPRHRPGSWHTTSSGRPVISSVAPGWPFARPGFRPDLRRSELGAGLASPSLDGGFDEFREF